MSSTHSLSIIISSSSGIVIFIVCLIDVVAAKSVSVPMATGVGGG
jgi:hypothetical protein